MNETTARETIVARTHLVPHRDLAIAFCALYGNLTAEQLTNSGLNRREIAELDRIYQTLASDA